MKTKQLLIILIICSAISACKKDETPEPAAPSKRDMLTGKNWMMKVNTINPAIDFDNNGTQENDLIPFMQACTLDDFLDLNSDGSYTWEEGDSKCSPNDPQVFESGDWSFNSDQTIVVFSPNGGQTYEFNITSLTSSRWEVESQVVSQGVTYTRTYAFE